MAKLSIPEDFKSQRTLLKKINEKVTTDGASSPLIPFFAKHLIVLADDEIAGGKADVQEASRLLYNKQSMNYIQLRDLGFDPIMEQVRAEMQVLKVFVKPNFRDLGTWGATVVAPSKIVYSSNFIDCTDLFTAIVTQNDTYPVGTSPLNAYLVKQNISLTDDAGIVATAIINNTKANGADAASVLATEKRNNFWETPLANVKLIGEYLMKLNGGSERELGLYGFTVTENKTPAKLRKSTVKSADKITLKGVLIGSVLTNIGTVDAHVYKGATTAGTPIIVHPGEVLGMTKGFSTVTVVNPSTLTVLIITVKVSNS